MQIKFSTKDTVALKLITLLHVVSSDNIEITASEISADFSLKICNDSSLKALCKMYSVFTRQKRLHEPLQGLNRRKNHTNISTAPCICRRLQGTGNDKEVVTTFGSRWQHYPCGAVSSHGWPLECADVLFIERGRVLL